MFSAEKRTKTQNSKPRRTRSNALENESKTKRSALPMKNQERREKKKSE
jgi:hypothetical protein